MKKLIVSVVIAVLSVSSLYAQSENTEKPIVLTRCPLEYTDGLGKLRPRTPGMPIVVYQDGHTKDLCNSGLCNSVVILSVEEETIIYEAFVTESSTLITIPDYIVGEYEIRLCCDTYYYVGTIIL
mgnify:CR=1 FL=1